MKAVNKIHGSMVYHGDNISVMDYSLPANSIDLVVTDPPYLFTKNKNTDEQKARSRKLTKTPLYDYSCDSGECLIKVRFTKECIDKWLDKIVRLMKKMNAFIFCSEEQLSAYHLWAEEHGYKFSVLVWEKPVEIVSKKRFSQNVEFIVRIYENGTGLNAVQDSQMYSRVISAPRIRKKLHPTQKPLEIMTRIILLASKEGDVVLDPFMGSGTTCVAAKRLERKYIGIEENEKFYNTAVERINKEPEQLKLFEA